MSPGNSRQRSLPFRNKGFITLRKILMFVGRGVIIQKAPVAPRSLVKRPDLPGLDLSKRNQVNLMRELMRDCVESTVRGLVKILNARHGNTSANTSKAGVIPSIESLL